jgi:predicted MPP superfamily phosphohydrolase
MSLCYTFAMELSNINFYLVILYGYVIVALLLLYFFNRDRKNPATRLGRNPWAAYVLIAFLVFGIGCAIDARYIEPNRLVTHPVTVETPDLAHGPIKIAFIGDLHVGGNKKTAWTQKVVNKIISLNPDIVVIGGDSVYNHGGSLDETEYLEPLGELPKHFPTYYVMGNHEYGYETYGIQRTPDQSSAVAVKMKSLGLILLKNTLACPKINNEHVCLYGIDDVYREQVNFDDLKNWNKNAPIILVTHNPDGILAWPVSEPQPAVTLAAHTHGGQIWLPVIGPLGRVPMKLGPEHYRGLSTVDGKLLFTTVGVSESGGPIRFLTPPEIALVTLETK